MSEQEPKPQKRRVPIGLPITAILLLLFGLFVAPAITNSFSEEQLNRNALLSGIGFLMVFISIVLFYVYLVWWLALKLNGKVSYKTFRIVEYIMIGGIVLGVVGMFQPWFFVAYRYGFYLLLLATLGFIAWTHVTPAPAEDDAAELQSWKYWGLGTLVVTVALIGALNRLTPGRLTSHEVAYTVQSVETNMLGQQCGIQDQLCAAYGGINFINVFDYP